MKIVYIGSATIPSKSANSVHIMKICEAFKVTGTDISLILPDCYENDMPKSEEEIFSQYGITAGFAILRNKAVRRSPVGISNYIFALTSVFKAMRLHPDVIFTRTPLVSVAASFLGIANILELHGRLNGLTLKLFRFFRTFSSKSLLNVVFISNPLKQIYLDEFKIDEDKTSVLPDGVTYRNFAEINTQPPLQGETFKIGYVGSLYKGRGIEVILGMAKAFPMHSFSIYGGEPNQTDLLKTQLTEENIANISLFGHVPNSEVPAILCSQDILLMPYQKKVQVRGSEDTAAWMSPMKMFEYMASGRVIMSSDMPVLREILNEENAYLMPPDNISSWIDTLRIISDNRAEAIEKALKAREDVQNLTWEKRVVRIKEIIRKKLKN